MSICHFKTSNGRFWTHFGSSSSSIRYLQILVPEHIDVFLHFRASGGCFGYFGCFHAIGRKISCRFVISKCQTDDSGPMPWNFKEICWPLRSIIFRCFKPVLAPGSGWNRSGMSMRSILNLLLRIMYLQSEQLPSMLSTRTGYQLHLPFCPRPRS